MTVTQSQTRTLLSRCSFLAGLPTDILDALCRRARLLRFVKGRMIFPRGEAGESLMIVVSGRVKVFNISADAREIVLNFLGEGDVLGEIAMLDGGERTANAVAIDETEVLALYRRDLLPVLMASPEALLEVVRALCDKLRATSAIVEENTLPMAACTSAGLLRLAEQHGHHTKHGIWIDLKLSQRDLGSYLGLSRENANRQLAVLRDAGYIKVENGKITILDKDALRFLAESPLD